MNDLCAAWADSRRHYYEKFVAHELAKVAGPVPVKDLSFHLANNLIAAWRLKYTRNTISTYRHTLRRLLRWLQSLGGPPDLVQELLRVPPWQPRRRTLTPEEEEKLMAAADPWMRCFLTICLTTALRSGEAIKVAPCHYNRERLIIQGIRVKNDKDHTVCVLPELAEIIDAVQADPACPIPYVKLLKAAQASERKGKLTGRMNFYILRWHFDRLRRKVGISEAVGLPKMHDLRRTCGTEHFRVGKDIVATSRLMGHSSVGITANYCQHIDQEGLRPVLERSRVLRFPRIQTQEKVG